MAKRRDGVRWGRLAIVLFTLAIINVPYALHEWDLHRAATSGTEVTATVVGLQPAGDDEDVSYRLPREVDPGQKLRIVRVHRDVALQAQQTKQLEMKVLDGHPSAVHVDGQVRSWAGLVLVVVADLIVGLMLLLSWRLGGRLRRPTLVAVAVEDVARGDEGSVLDKQDDGTYLINGEVAECGPSSVRLSLRDRDVEINLRDHINPVQIGQWAQVRAQLVG
jgi:hypothetical protein